MQKDKFAEIFEGKYSEHNIFQFLEVIVSEYSGL